MKLQFNMLIFNSNQKSFYFFLLVFFLLSIGVYENSSTKHFDKLAIVLSSFIFVYLISSKFIKDKYLDFNKIFNIKVAFLDIKFLNLFLLIISITLIILDMVVLGGPPIVKALSSSNLKTFCDIREDIHNDSSKIFVYLSSVNIKAILPFTLFHFVVLNKKKIFIPLIFLAGLYGFSMMQKSFMFSIFFPTISYILIQKKWILSISLTLILLIGVFSLTVLLNKYIDDEEKDDEEKIVKVQSNQTPFLFRLSKGLIKRVVIVPGETISQWFNVIPEKKPYLYGDGYPFIAKLRARKYIDYSKELYPILKPDYAKKGLSGTVNVASFVREYSNFGYLGLFWGGALIALVLVFIDKMFLGYENFYYSINLFPIFLFSSSSILTILFSGGWFVFILLFFIFYKSYNQQICAE